MAAVHVQYVKQTLLESLPGERLREGKGKRRRKSYKRFAFAIPSSGLALF